MMLLRKLTMAAAVLAALAQGACAVSIQDFFKRNTVTGTVSLLGTLWNGIRVGTAAGIASGWARSDGKDGQGTLTATGAGALIGAGFGLLAELTGNGMTGNRIISDTGYGGRLGAGAGALAGSAAALFTGKSENVAQGTAWGTLAGAALGFGYAAYQALTGGYTEQKKKESIPLPLPVPLPQGFRVAPHPSGTVLLTFEKYF